MLPSTFELLLQSVTEDANQAYETPAYSVSLYAGDTEVAVYAVLRYATIAHFLTNYSAETFVQLRLGLGDYQQTVVASREKLRVVLTVRSTTRIKSTQLSFRAILNNNVSSSDLETRKQATGDIEHENQMGMYDAIFELVDDEIAAIRNEYVGFPALQTTLENFVVGVLGKSVSEFTKSLGTPMPKFEVEPFANQQTYPALVIPQDVPVLGLPDYLQKTYGLYGTGLGFFFYNKTWYLWGLLNTAKASDSTNRLVILVPPKLRAFALDKSFRVIDNQLIVIANGTNVHVDRHDAKTVGVPTSVRVPDSRLLGEDSSKMSGQMAYSQGNETSRTIVASRRADGLSQHKVDLTASRNVYKLSSEMAKSTGSMLKVDWLHSDCTLLKPGMAVEINTVVNGKVVVKQGILVGFETYRIKEGAIAFAGRYREVTALMVFVGSAV